MVFNEISRLSISVPFLKDTVIDFQYPIIYILFVSFVLTGTSNGVNLTDGLDGLAAGTVAIAISGFAIIAYVLWSCCFQRLFKYYVYSWKSRTVCFFSFNCGRNFRLSLV